MQLPPIIFQKPTFSKFILKFRNQINSKRFSELSTLKKVSTAWFSAALKDVVVTFGGVVSGSVQLGLSEEKVTEPTFVTVRADAELSVNNPEAFVCNKSNFVLATAVVGTVGTVKFAVYREVPFTKWKLVIRPGN